MDLPTLLAEARKLSKSEQELLAQALLTSISRSGAVRSLQALETESDSRISGYEAGELLSESTDTVFARLRTGLE